MKSHVQKWGNSLAVRIPKAFADDLGLSRDAAVELALEDGCLVVRPAAAQTYELSDLISRVCDENLHGEQDYGPAVGSEEW